MKYKSWWDYNHIKLICMEWEHLGIESNCARWNSMIMRAYFVLISCSNSLLFIRMPLEPHGDNEKKQIWISLVHCLIVKKEMEMPNNKMKNGGMTRINLHMHCYYHESSILIESMRWNRTVNQTEKMVHIEEKAAISSFCVYFFLFIFSFQFSQFSGIRSKALKVLGMSI